MKRAIDEFKTNLATVATVVALVAVPTGLLISHVWTQYQITEVGYNIASVTSEHRELLEENKKLTVEARMQGRSDRVAEVAIQEFGLEQMSPEQLVEVQEGAEAQPEELVQLSAAEGDRSIQ